MGLAGDVARRRLGSDADLLARPLPFGDGAFDDVIAALVCTTWTTGPVRWPSCGPAGG